MAVNKKKVIDTWKTKQWYTIIAPKLFNEVDISQMPASEDETLMNRIIVYPLKDITRDISHLYTNVKLRVESIVGKKAYTKFIGHSIAREYLQALGRANRSLLYIVFDTTSADGVEFKVKCLIVTNGKASASQRAALRKELIQRLSAKIQKQDFGPFIQETLYGKASSELHGVLKKIFPVKRVELYKTELKEVFDVETVESEEGEDGNGGKSGEGTDAKTQTGDENEETEEMETPTNAKETATAEEIPA